MSECFIVQIRPHHLICNLCFRGKGYNEEFIRNFYLIQKRLSNQNTVIQIVNVCDDICNQCPMRKDRFCNHEEKVKRIDNIYLDLLELKIDQTITFDELKIRIKKFLSMDGFQYACKDCAWYTLNICEPIMREIIDADGGQTRLNRV